ncbi:hypothetical protein BHE74_00007121 [Ensete ventricosum]|nr:hypothetical protein BHE74_00007121 [Ensete ventricosum]
MNTRFTVFLHAIDIEQISRRRTSKRRRLSARPSAGATIFGAVAALRHLATVASLCRRHCSRWSSPSSLLFAAVAVAAAPLALGQVSSSPRFYYSPLPASIAATLSLGHLTRRPSLPSSAFPPLSLLHPRTFPPHLPCSCRWPAPPQPQPPPTGRRCPSPRKPPPPLPPASAASATAL